MFRTRPTFRDVDVGMAARRVVCQPFFSTNRWSSIGRSGSRSLTVCFTDQPAAPSENSFEHSRIVLRALTSRRRRRCRRPEQQKSGNAVVKVILVVRKARRAPSRFVPPERWSWTSERPGRGEAGTPFQNVSRSEQEHTSGQGIQVSQKLQDGAKSVKTNEAG